MISDCHNMDYKLTSSHFGFTFLHNFKFAYFTLYTCTFTHCSHSHFSHEHIHIYTFTFSAVTHSPNHQRRTYTHHITHRRHLGIPMATLGLRRPGEQVSTLTSGTCPPPGFPPNALRVTYTLNFLRGTFPWYSSTALYGSSVTLAQLHIYTFTVLHMVLHLTLFISFTFLLTWTPLFFLTWYYRVSRV